MRRMNFALFRPRLRQKQRTGSRRNWPFSCRSDPESGIAVVRTVDAAAGRPDGTTEFASCPKVRPTPTRLVGYSAKPIKINRFVLRASPGAILSLTTSGPSSVQSGAPGQRLVYRNAGRGEDRHFPQTEGMKSGSQLTPQPARACCTR